MFMPLIRGSIQWILGLTLFAISTMALALETKTDLLELKVGSIDEKTGAKIEEIAINETENLREVTISVPAKTGQIQEVVVTSSAPKKNSVKQIKPFKFLKDYEHDRYGLVIYLGKNEELPLLFYFYVPPG